MVVIEICRQGGRISTTDAKGFRYEAKPQARDRKGDDTIETQEIEGDGDAEARAAERRVVRLSD